jgi:Ca2+-binding RTX toxin-like protein
LEKEMAGIFGVEGFGFLSNFNGSFVSTAANNAMQGVADTNANSISLAPRFFMQTKTSNDVMVDPAKSESDANIVAAIDHAHQLGLSVMLKPMVTGLDGSWQYQLTPSDPGAFFSSYTNEIVHLAGLAQQAGAESFSIGNELSHLTGEQYRDDWVHLIDAVRSVYHGTITYAAATDEANHVSFWDQVDTIGVDAYPPLTSQLDPSVDQMVAAWNEVPRDNYWAGVMNHMSPVDFFHSLALDYQKPVEFTEIGYRSLDGTNISPGGWSGSTTPDNQEQADAFNAFFQVMGSEAGSWFKGAEIWNWDADNLFSSTGYSPMGKPAQQVITDWYGGVNHAPDLHLQGSPADDLMDVGSGNDMLSGGLGNDVIHGGPGQDMIDGGPATITPLADTTVTVTGYSSMVDGVGADMALTVNGQQIGDTVQFHEASSPAEYQTYTFSFHNPDAIQSLDVSFLNDLANGSGDRNLLIKGITVNGQSLTPADAINSHNPGSWNLYQNGSIHYDMTTHQDLFFGDATDNDTLDGGTGNDTINGGAGTDIIHGGDGIDTIDGGAGIVGTHDQLFGDGGNDVIKAGKGDTGALLDGGLGNDQLYGTIAANVMNGDDGHDYMSGGGGADVMHGGAGDDVMTGGTAATQMYGDDGNDAIRGSTGNESLFGGAGNDKLSGGAGNDTLNGGSGNDTFVFAPNFGKDTIADFQNTGGTQDILQFDHTIFADFSTVESHMAQVGSDVVITVDDHNSVVVQNMTLSNLHASDFHFV